MVKKEQTHDKKIISNPIFCIQCVICAVVLVVITLINIFLPLQMTELCEFVLSNIESKTQETPLARFSQQVIGFIFLDVNAKGKKDDELPNFDVAASGSSFDDFSTELQITLPVNNYYISSDYGWRTDPYTNEWSFHNGIDLASPQGEPVYSFMAGVVEKNVYSTSYGNYLQLRHEDGSVTLYAHLQYAFVREGEIVEAGAKIGTVGNTGRSTGAHLHFETIVDNTRLDPTIFFN